MSRRQSRRRSYGRRQHELAERRARGALGGWTGEEAVTDGPAVPSRSVGRDSVNRDGAEGASSRSSAASAAGASRLHCGRDART